MSPEIRVFRPRLLQAALEMLAGPTGDNPVVLAGGTDLMRQIGRGGPQPLNVVDISGIEMLQGVSALPGGRLRINALTTFRELGSDPLVGERAPLLAEAARGLGAVQTQARATLGGNIARGSSASDSPPVLLAQGGEVLLLSCDGGERRCPFELFFGADGPAVRKGELIASVFLSPLPPGVFQIYRKVAARRAQGIAKVLFAGVATLDAGQIAELRLAAGAVGPTPLRLVGAEAAAIGRNPSECADTVAGVAASEVQPIDDFRSTADYRRHVLRRLVRGFVRSLEE